MSKSTQRYFESLNREKKQRATLTHKQYLVYTYLITLSKWNARDKEEHYYVYKNSFVIKEACGHLGITEPTWRAAIRKLRGEKISNGKIYYTNDYIKDEGNYYLIYIPKSYAALELDLIKLLMSYGVEMGKDRTSGHIVSVYSTIYNYYEICTNRDMDCILTIE